jgi:glutamate/tyrosine decarboxylase-like PLP-dependent enzyme
MRAVQSPRLVQPPRGLSIILQRSEKLVRILRRETRKALTLYEKVTTQPSLWLHVDAAWAGVSMACPEYRELCLLDDINKYADSFCTNFHKAGALSRRALWFS